MCLLSSPHSWVVASPTLHLCFGLEWRIQLSSICTLNQTHPRTLSPICCRGVVWTPTPSLADCVYVTLLQSCYYLRRMLMSFYMLEQYAGWRGWFTLIHPHHMGMPNASDWIVAKNGVANPRWVVVGRLRRCLQYEPAPKTGDDVIIR